MSTLNVIIEGHSIDCRVIKSGDYHLGVYGGFEMRDKLGRRYKDRRGWWWDRYGCNDPDCPGVTLILRQDLDALVLEQRRRQLERAGSTMEAA